MSTTTFVLIIALIIMTGIAGVLAINGQDVRQENEDLALRLRHVRADRDRLVALSLPHDTSACDLAGDWAAIEAYANGTDDGAGETR